MARMSSMTVLPSPNTKRWVARRNAAVVAAVSSGTITLEEACRRYQMSEEEFFAWQRAFETFGLLGLRASSHVRRILILIPQAGAIASRALPVVSVPGEEVRHVYHRMDYIGPHLRVHRQQDRK